jgi:[acyl-carrier-protein] S-malonyltransferase
MGPCPFPDVAGFMTENASARRLVGIADDVLGFSLVDRFRESADDYSDAAQVAFLVNCLASAEWAEQWHGMEPALCAGPSFGVKAAAAYVGALPMAEAIGMTARLARCAHDYFSRAHRDVITHSFVRAPEDRLRPVLAELEHRGEWYEVSCWIDRDFYMLSLRERNLDWLQRRLRSVGALPLYTMRPPMHATVFGALRAKAAEEVVDALKFSRPRIPIVADHDGELVTSADGVRALVLDGFVKSLRWPVVVRAMRSLGISRVYVSGPDSLFGRVRCTTENFDVVPAGPKSAMRAQRA